MEVQTTHDLVQLEYLDNGLAIITLGSADERVITLTPTRMKSLRAAIEEVKTKRPKGLVICGPRAEMFTAGADISVIKNVTDPKIGEALAREGQSLFDEIENLPFCTVAAISGPCVGGGCEMVLACTRRVISDEKSSLIGLPEVKLGILPGFGGTQRLPRLIGIDQALDIILSGKTVRAKTALKLGLVDQVVPYPKLREAAEKIALNPTKFKTKNLSLLRRFLTYTNIGRQMVASNAEAQVKKETKGFYPAPVAALESVLFGLSKGKQAGLDHEAKELGRLIVTPESKSLVRIFFLTEGAKTLGKTARKAVEHLQTVVIGAGVMGAGIAAAFAKNECGVIMRDSSEQNLKRGMSQIKSYFSKLKYLSDTDRSFILNRIEATSKDTANLGSATFAIEAIFEELAAKKAVLSQVASLMPDDAIIATNTSSLSVTEIAQGIDHPERVVGMHFFNPVDKMPLVEIVRAEQTSDRTIAVIAALSSKLGKFPIVVKDVPGFLVNRILSPYLNEAAYLLADGYSIEEIDSAATAFGMPMGPIRLLDEVGLDVAAHVSKIMLAGYGERMRGPTFAEDLVKLGRLGKKSSAGFYDFPDKQQAVPHPKIQNLLKIKANTNQDSQIKIIDRLLMSLINEAVLCLEQGVAGSPGPEAASQIDLASVMGFGFPPFRGGLIYYADTVGAQVLLDKISQLESKFGARFAVAKGIRTRAKVGMKFSERIP